MKVCISLICMFVIYKKKGRLGTVWGSRGRCESGKMAAAAVVEFQRVQSLLSTDREASIDILHSIVKHDNQENDEEAVQVKEQSILELGSLLAKTGQAAGKSYKWVIPIMLCLQHQMECLSEHKTIFNTQFICVEFSFIFLTTCWSSTLKQKSVEFYFIGEGKSCFCWDMVICDLFLVFEFLLYFLTCLQQQSSATSLTCFGIFKESERL